MERAITLWQFKDTEFTRPDLDQFLGASMNQWDKRTEMRVLCRRATKDAKAKAKELSARGIITIIIEEVP